MGSSGPITLLAICLLCYVLSICGLIIGCYGNAWWVLENDSVKREQGLWEDCSKSANLQKRICHKREDLFDFDGKKNAEKDTILIILIASAIFCFLGFLSALLMICYRRREETWKCSALVSFSIALIGALVGFGGLGYAEFEFDDMWKITDHGWSALLAWVGVAAQLLAAVLSCVLMFVIPTESDRKQTVHYVGNTNPTYQGDQYR